MPKINLDDVPETNGTNYPTPYDSPCISRRKKAISDASRLTQFGAHIITLPPGAWSSQRHWYSAEDELVYIIKGSPLFIDEKGETRLNPGDITAHPAGDENGHHMKNDTNEDVQFLIIGTRNPVEDHAHYPDIDLDLPANGPAERHYRRKDGRPY
ncbi:cupin domain-containing protein [Hellea balneolensis]|uniref:cupin domain-containing protein n=1 Tax=Hellea balneolensis TaxID=287478 RepID=UPI0004017AFC|nr:cupin domain-containing protein [Hellea balneolensis]